jgi:CDP-diacylglycerol--glycerol-3-phosphate 3-phosphatidyltransferase
LTDIQSTEKITLTDRFRKTFKGILDPIGGFFNRLGLTPNTMTLIGLFGNMIGAFFLARGQMTIGGLFIFLMGPVDALDGTMARLRGESGVYGAFVDSVTDRYSELVIFGGLVYYFASIGDTHGAILAYAAAAGSVLVSYVRARAQSLGYEAKVGYFTRMERYLVLAPLLVLNLPFWAVLIVAIGANITAVQRIIHIRREVHKQSAKTDSKPDADS